MINTIQLPTQPVFDRAYTVTGVDTYLTVIHGRLYLSEEQLMHMLGIAQARTLHRHMEAIRLMADQWIDSKEALTVYEMAVTTSPRYGKYACGIHTKMMKFYTLDILFEVAKRARNTPSKLRMLAWISIQLRSLRWDQFGIQVASPVVIKYAPATAAKLHMAIVNLNAKLATSRVIV